ncbi:MAG: Calx-beta domain-containing protein, partial [Lacipirellulaceae bacterium]
MAKNRKSRSLFRGFNPKFKQAKRTRKTRSNKPAGLTFENLEPRQLLAVATFQEGLNNYIGAQDTVLFSQARDSNFGGETAISVDQQDANGVRQGLLQFSDLFGDSSIGFTQIPEGSTINSATLSFEITNPSTSQAQISMYRMLVTWDEGSATWNTFGDIGGVQASEGEATALPADYTLFDPRRTSVLGADAPVSDPDRVPGDPGTFDVTRSLQSWSAGETVNNGWLIESTATDGWDLSTSEDAQGSRPFLRVDFTPPSANQDTISFLDSRVTKNEGGDGTQTLSLTVARLGGNSGTDTVTFAVADGTATDTGPSDDYDVATAGNTLTFMPGEITKTIDITINDDTVLEGNETLTVTLSNPVGASLGSNFQTTVTIADNDALINEVLANVSDVDNIGVDETDREYVELIGTPGASLDDYYFVVFEGQEEEAGGGGGVADLVVNLAGQTFGANGLLVLRPTNWLYTKAADSNELVVPSLGTLNGLEDDSQTYALVRTTGLAPVQGTDYDTIGAYVGTSQDALDSPLGEVGLLDVAPFTVGGDAQIVDSVSVFNGGSDRDRAIVTGDLGLPGVHVHQPTRTLNGADNVASDAVSRLNGNTQPNTIGSWFNGDILSTEADDLDSVGGDNDVIEYQNGSTKISAVAPDGSVLTPGALNVLNNVFIEADVVSIDEPGGGTVNVTFTVTRTGDLSSPLSVSYNTVDGSAKAGSDFVGQPSGTVNFTADALASVQTKTITVVV